MRFIITILTMLVSVSALAKPLSYYFEQDVKFDPSIPTPEQVLGYEVGEWHVRHDHDQVPPGLSSRSHSRACCAAGQPCLVCEAG